MVLAGVQRAEGGEACVRASVEYATTACLGQGAGQTHSQH